MSARTLTPKVFAVKGPYGYDQASNRLWCQNVVAGTGQDEFYTYDGLYQLKEFQRGTLNTLHTGLTGTPAWEEDFTFDPTGNLTPSSKPNQPQKSKFLSVTTFKP